MSRSELKRILGVGDGLAVVVGIVIGLGILRTPGLIAGYLGDPWLIILDRRRLHGSGFGLVVAGVIWTKLRKPGQA